MYSSDYCRLMISQYTEAKGKVEALLEPLGTCSSAVASGIPYMEAMIMNGEQIDKGQLSNISVKLSKIADDFAAIIAECSQKISYWSDELAAAIEREKAAAAAANSATSTDAARVESRSLR